MICITQPSTSKEYDVLAEMLEDYIAELHDIEPTVNIGTKEELRIEYFFASEVKFHLILADKEVVGFCMIGFGDNCHKDVERYIEEFYIKPEYRGKGYGKTAIDMILHQIDSVCFFVLRANAVAITFWDKFFAKWKDISEELEDVSTKYCKFKAYRRK